MQQLGRTYPRGGKVSVAGVLAAFTLLAAHLCSHVAAQPFVADGGFGRPWQLAGPGIVPSVAVAADADRAVVVWADAEGVWLEELATTGDEPMSADDDTTVNITGPGSIRAVSAAMVDGEPAVAWLQRDLRTGNTAHMLNWRGQDHLLFDSVQETALQLGTDGSSPWVLAARRFGGEAHLQLFTFDGTGGLKEPATLHSTSLAVRGATALVASAEEAGQPRWVGWLEGETTSGPFGLDAEWSAFALRLDPAGQSSGEPLELGMADVVDERQVVILGSVLASGEAGPESGDEYARALWLGVDGTLQLTTIQATDDGGEVVDILDLEESGRPLAVSAEHAYWHDAEFVRRTTLVGAASDVTGSQAISVAWSPVIIAGAEFAVVGSEGAPDRTVIGWFGRTQGGSVEAYVTDDSRPFEASLTDRLAAAMGWSPWSWWQEAAGQLLTSLLVGIIGVMALSPLLFALSLVVARLKPLAARPVVGGVVLGILTPLAIAALVAWRFPSSAVAQLDAEGWAVIGAALLFGAAVAYLINRRADREAQFGVLFTACTLALVAIGTWAFIEYAAWAPVVGLG